MEKIRETARADVQDRTRMLVQAGALAALSCAATMVLRIPSPTGGYLNLGDAVVLLGAYLLGPAWGALAGGIGPALADLLAGYAAYVPATLVIKALMGLLAALGYRWARERAGGWTAACAVIAEMVMVAGYALYDGFLSGSLAVGMTGVPGNIVQGAFGAAASTLVCLALRRSGYVRRVFPRL